ncbi:Adt-1p [Tyrophagus putrescentiae]|nr:Adt-1p [Tyrophagus putrescentiae]
MNAVQLLFKQPSIGRSVEISVVLMDLLKQQPKRASECFDGLVLDFGSITRARALTLMEYL